MRLFMAGKRAAICAALALAFVVAAPVGAGAAPTGGLDSVNATGSASPDYSNINITAQSDTSGQNASGTGTFTIFGALTISGPVTCLSVTGPDQGGGTAGAPTLAILNIQDSSFGIVTVVLQDNGGNGIDTISALPSGRAPTDCSSFSGVFSDALNNGRATVFDAPLLPTSKEQCKNGGYAQFGFKNQGQCVAFVNHQ